MAEYTETDFVFWKPLILLSAYLVQWSVTTSQSASIIDAILYYMLVVPNYIKKYLQECRSVDLLMMRFSIDRVCDNTP